MGIFNRHRHLRPEILSEYLDGRLNQRRQELVARRLSSCPSCREELNTLQATVSALQSLPDLPLPRSFTLPTAPSPDFPANLSRKPAPPALLIMRMPGWAYGGAASLAALALALMLSAEAAGLASPASFPETGQTTEQAIGQTKSAPGDAAVAEETQVEAQVEPPVAAFEMADQAEPALGSQAATPSLAARQGISAPTSEAAAETPDSPQAAKILAEPADPPLETAMAESQGNVASDPEAAAKEAASDAVSHPATRDAAVFSGTPSHTGTSSEPGIPSDYGSVPADSPPAVTEAVPAPQRDSARSLATEAETPKENLSFPVEQYSATSSPIWWKALETMFAALTLALLGALFFRWRRNRSQSDS